MALKCPTCNIDMRSMGTKVVNNEYILRTKKCLTCGYKLRTIEIKEEVYNNTIGALSGITKFLRSVLGVNP